MAQYAILKKFSRKSGENKKIKDFLFMGNSFLSSEFQKNIFDGSPWTSCERRHVALNMKIKM